MNITELTVFYEKDKYALNADLLKFLLMPFVFIVILGFPGKYGSYVSLYSNFAAPAFFILCGFFTLVPDVDKRLRKLKRAFKRAAILFVSMFLVYMLINMVYLAYLHSLNIIASSEIIRKRTIFNFFVLNIWFPLPMGSSIWFIQSLSYAYAFFILAEKFKLSRFYIPLLVSLVAFMLAVGEFAVFLKFPHFGYDYIPGGAVTRAIPYMLIGMLLRKNVGKFLRFKTFYYVVLFFVGLAMAVAEIEILRRTKMLVYTAHTVGFGVMAAAVCCITLKKPVVKRNFISKHARHYAKRMYAFCQPCSMLIWMLYGIIKPETFFIVRQYSSLLCFAICFALSIIISLVKYSIAFEQEKELNI